jgi:hypothetical protein
MYPNEPLSIFLVDGASVTKKWRDIRVTQNNLGSQQPLSALACSDWSSTMAPYGRAQLDRQPSFVSRFEFTTQLQEQSSEPSHT